MPSTGGRKNESMRYDSRVTGTVFEITDAELAADRPRFKDMTEKGQLNRRLHLAAWSIWYRSRASRRPV